jgi:hypothetical protein
MQPIIPAEEQDEQVEANRVPSGQAYEDKTIADCYGEYNF